MLIDSHIKDSLSKPSDSDSSSGDCGDSSSSAGAGNSLQSLAFNVEVYDQKGRKQDVNDLPGNFCAVGMY